MRNPLARLVRRDDTKPTLRQRAASLKASAARVIQRKPVVLPAPGSDEAKALFKAACMETDRLDRAAAHGYPELRRTIIEWWTRESLTAALEAGTMSAIEFARLYPMAFEREHRIDAAALATNVGALQVLAFAGDYGRPVQENADPVFSVIEANRAAEAAMMAFGEDSPSPATPAVFAEEDRLEADQIRTRAAALATVPTTRAGQLALLQWIEWQIKIHCHPVGGPAAGHGTIWAASYRSLANVLKAEPGVRDAEVGEDADLLDIGRRWSQLQADYVNASERAGDVESKHPGPKRPHELNVYSFDLMNGFPHTYDTNNGRFPYDRKQVEELRAVPRMAHYVGGNVEGVKRSDGAVLGVNPHAQKRAEAIIAAWDRWQAEIAAHDAALNLPELRAAATATYDARQAAVLRARGIKARTHAGVLVKAKIAADLVSFLDRDKETAKRDADDEDAMLWSLLSDVLGVCGHRGYGIVGTKD